MYRIPNENAHKDRENDRKDHQPQSQSLEPFVAVSEFFGRFASRALIVG